MSGAGALYSKFWGQSVRVAVLLLVVKLASSCTHTPPNIKAQQAGLDQISASQEEANRSFILSQIAMLDGQVSHYDALINDAEARAAGARAIPGQEGLAAGAEAEATSYRARKSALAGERAVLWGRLR